MIEKSTKGVMDFCFEKIEEAQGNNEMDMASKFKTIDMFLKHVWTGARIELEHKKFMIKAPELAKATNLPVMLGSAKA